MRAGFWKSLKWRFVKWLMDWEYSARCTECWMAVYSKEEYHMHCKVTGHNLSDENMAQSSG